MRLYSSVPPPPPSSSSSKSVSLATLAGAVAAACGGTYLLATRLSSPNVRETSLDLDFSRPKYGGPAEVQTAIAEFTQLLGADAVSTDDDDLKRHGYSEWSTWNTDVNPSVIVYPRSTEQVSQIAKICSKHKLPMVPYSGGTSLEGNISAPYGGVCIDMAFMDRILAVHEEDMDAVVQPAVDWMDLNLHLEATGSQLLFGVEPGPSAKIGGMVNTTCSGTSSVRYGPMRDNIINLTAVLADGTVIKTRRRPRKSSAGYSLHHLISGSEGTLAIVTEITVKLHPKPAVTQLALCTFPTLTDATKAASDIIRSGVAVGALEFMNARAMQIVNQSGITPRVWDERPTLIMKFVGTEKGTKEQLSIVDHISKQHNGGNFIYPKTAKEEKELWSARKEIHWCNIALFKGEVPQAWSTDVAVPISRLAEAVDRANEEMDNLGIAGGLLGHVGDGNYHAGIVFEKDDDDTRARIKEFSRRIVQHGLELEGTCTGEHGIGAGKIDYLVDELGPETVAAMRTIKKSLDPHELLNPGKVFDAGLLEKRFASK
ncbi:hypothetical protein CANCADRAFT_802 [Tortispora caseinolytica NRRL Y-17796]|uniref:D-lactate dehydrogenase (cytochrome) n=1 Tax=Tortispora caseinolytica NRRL Y-17796 TaxID=767744 RepID=A0A1E4TKE1_9ASCO|nr:hypothetical protein CANCADRAFT_802 [Tortispora caseinolytica NRRL Y-17796]